MESREDRAGESAGRGGRHRTPFRDASDAAERQRGGHNGLKKTSPSCWARRRTARIRFGIGGDFARGHQVDYVLGSSWSDEERKALPERLKVFAEAVLSFATIGAERTMNLYNKR